MKTDAAAAKRVKDACEDALLRRGFVRLGRDLVVHEIDDAFLGWVGLNVGKHSGFIRINPFAGVHCTPVMKLIADLSGEKYQRGRYATFAKHLGEICPNVRVFDFAALEEIDAEADRLATVYCEHGLPFMKGLANYQRLLGELEERVPMLGGYPQRVAATLHIMGRTQEAVDFVKERQDEYRDDPAVMESFDRFASPFLQLVGA